jgi:hypothetical protein
MLRLSLVLVVLILTGLPAAAQQGRNDYPTIVPRDWTLLTPKSNEWRAVSPRKDAWLANYQMLKRYWNEHRHERFAIRSN